MSALQDEIELKAWLRDPSLFWLHPEGPLSDTTPAEWLARRPATTIVNDECRSSVRVTHFLPGEHLMSWGELDCLTRAA